MKEATKAELNVVNGVNVDDMMNTINAINDDTAIAAFKFRANNHWVRGGENRTTVNDYDGAKQKFARDSTFVINADEPPVLLGNDTGANPVEILLAALAGCMTTGLVYHAAAKGIRLNKVESEFEGDIDLRGFLGLDESVRNGYEEIRVKFRVEGDATDDQLRELVEISKQRSPVFDIVTNKIPVKVEMAG